MKINSTVQFKQWPCVISKGLYDNGRPALHLSHAVTGEPIAKATVNLPKEYLSNDEVFIKSWSENETMMTTLINAKVIGPIRSMARAGRCYATRHKLLI